MINPWLSRTNTQKRCPFYHRCLECKVGSQETPGVTGKFGFEIQNEAGQRLTEFCQESTLVIANTLFQQHKRQLYTWTSPDGQHRNQVDYILCSLRWRSFLQSVKTRLAADCGSDHEHLIAKFRLKFKKVGKTTRPFRYDLNQIPYSYTMEMTQIQGIRSDRHSAWRTMDRDLWHCTRNSDQDHLKEKEMEKGKMVVRGGLTNSYEKKRRKNKR